MRTSTIAPPLPLQAGPVARHRHACLDRLKVLLVAGVIAGHAAIAWTGFGSWTVYEPPLREPLFTLVVAATLTGALFAMGLMFFIAGLLTPDSLTRKGTGRFLLDRTVRLGVPMLGYTVLISPVLEYVDTDNAGFTGGFWAFLPQAWWPPAPGPTWFLGVLLVFSAAYALLRRRQPAVDGGPALRARWLLIAATIIALASFAIRVAVPLGEEWARLAIGQAPAWMVLFALGTLGGRRRWFDPVPGPIARGCGVAAAAAIVALLGILAAADNPEVFTGGGSWQSLLLAAIESVIAVGVSVALLQLFRHRYNRQGPLSRAMSRAAYAAFLIHPPVLVGLILALRHLPVPTEARYLLATGLAVAGSYALAAALVRLPGLRQLI